MAQFIPRISVFVVVNQIINYFERMVQLNVWHMLVDRQWQNSSIVFRVKCSSLSTSTTTTTIATLWWMKKLRQLKRIPIDTWCCWEKQGTDSKTHNLLYYTKLNFGIVIVVAPLTSVSFSAFILIILRYPQNTFPVLSRSFPSIYKPSIEPIAGRTPQ